MSQNMRHWGLLENISYLFIIPSDHQLNLFRRAVVIVLLREHLALCALGR